MEMTKMVAEVPVEFTPRGIHVVPLGLWLDPAEGCETAWISHGHPSHARAIHGTAIATPETLELYRMRFPEAPASSLRPLKYGESMALGAARLTPYPSGHLPGAAQLLIEAGGDRILYTGDVRFSAPLLGREPDQISCDRLIVESTFGLPVYRFLSREEARSRILAFARDCFENKTIPTYMASAPGAAQEVLSVLLESGTASLVESAVAQHIPFFERHGFPLRGGLPYEGRASEGQALVVSREFRRPPEARNLRVALVSGRAGLDNARAQAGAEELIPYSSHADFEDLLALVEAAAPREVDVVHGYAEAFAHILYQRGWNAHARETG